MDQQGPLEIDFSSVFSTSRAEPTKNRSVVGRMDTVNHVTLFYNYITFSTLMGIIFVWNWNISMETQKTKTKPFLHSISKSLTASLMAFDLPILIERMKHTPTWTIEELHAEVLFKSPARLIVLTALRAGTEIESYQSDRSVTFQVIEGEIKIHTRNGSITIGQGKMLLIKEKMKYSLTTGEDTVLLLTIVKDTF